MRRGWLVGIGAVVHSLVPQARRGHDVKCAPTVLLRPDACVEIDHGRGLRGLFRVEQPMTSPSEAPLDLLAPARLVPLLQIEVLEDAVPLARTFVEAGLPVMEIALRTKAAAEAIKMHPAGGARRSTDRRQRHDGARSFNRSPGRRTHGGQPRLVR